MAIDLDTSPGGLFRRLGVIFFALKSANLYSGSTDISAGGLKSLGVTYTGILAQYASALQQEVNDLFTTITNGRGSLSALKSAFVTLAENTLIDQVHADAVLTDKSKTGAMKELIRQMIGAGTLYNADDDVDAPTVSASPAAVATNTGTGKVVASVVGPDGRNRENVFAEVMEVEVSLAAAGGATARQEQATLKGENAVTDPLAYDWPAGSGANTTLTTVDAALDNSGGNLLTNSDFETFTVANTPDNWPILVGAAGTDIFSEATTVFRTGKALKFTGTGGSPLSSIAQTFDETASVGTPGQLKPNTVYAVNCWMRKSASLAAGNIEIRLLNSSNAVVNDDAGTANTISVAHGALSSAAWTAVNGFWRTPKTVVPDTTVLKANVRVSTALTSGESVYIDDLAIAEAVEAYPGGPYLAMFAGDTDFLLADKFNVTIANNRAGEFQEWFDRVFGMKALGLQLPSDAAAGETLLDSWIA